MRLGIMQPYFFPYLGHFGLIAACDRWVVFDTCQYTPRSWMNRNRVLHPAAGWTWATAQLRNGSVGIRAQDALLADPAVACRSLLGRLSHLRRTAPHYDAVATLIGDVFDGAGLSLVELNVRALAAVCRYIGLPFRADRLSRLGLDLPDRLPPGGWAPAICTALGAASYVNPAGGRALFDPADFARHGVALHFAEARPFAYTTPGSGFVPDLSILDVLLWNTPGQVLAAVRGCVSINPA